MAMELFVFSDRQPGSIAEWNAALAELGFEVVIEESGCIVDLNGSWPTKLRGLAFRWGSDIYAHPAVFMAATAYAKATDGVVLDEWEPIFRKWDEVAEIARQADLETPKLEAWLREREQERNKK